MMSIDQGRREGGRGGNFYRGPDLKKGPNRAKFTFFESYFKILPGPRIKSTVLSTALPLMRWFIRLSSLNPKKTFFASPFLTSWQWFDWWEKLQLDRGKTRQKNSSTFLTRPFRNLFFFDFPQKFFSVNQKKG
jgi:hypothetical protein